MSDRDKPIPETPDASQELARELACVDQIADLLGDSHADPHRVFALVVQVIPSAWQHPENCGARITVGDSTFHSSGFREVSPVHKADIFAEGKLVGAIEVCFTQPDLQAREEALSPEKCRFIDTIATRLSSFLSLQHVHRLSASHRVLNREAGISGNQNTTDEIARPAPHETQYGGLCMTCVHSSTCSFQRSEDHPVMSCEEFDDGGGRPTGIARADDHPVPNAQSRVTDATHEPPVYTGLCATCDNRETCTFPKPEGGIWHCEEFA